MYNATEQFADIDKVNYANVVKLASLSIENTEKIVKLNLTAAKAALVQGVESAQAVASVKDVQELVALRAKFTEAGVQAATGYSKHAVRTGRGSASRVHGVRRRSLGVVHEGCRRVRRQGEQVGPGRLGCRFQRVQVDVRRFDGRVRPVPEGDQAGREPGRRELPRRGRASDQDGQGQARRLRLITEFGS